MAAELGLGIAVSMQDNFSSSAGRIGGAIDALGRKAFFLNELGGAVTRLTNTLGGFTQPFIELDSQVKNIGTLGVENFEEFNELATKASKEIPDSAADIAKGVYTAISAGIQGTNQEVLDFVKTASKAAVAGLSTTEAAVDGLTTVLNAYKLETTAAGEVSDTFFAAIKLGKTTFPEMNAALANVVPNASAVGVGFDEVSAAIAQMTSLGVPTAQASTRIRQALVELQKPGTELKKIMKAAGLSVADIQEKLKNEGLIATLQELEQTATASGKTMTQVFSSVEAGGAALLLTGDNAASATEKLAGVRAEIEGGVSTQAYDVASQSISVKMRIAANKVQAAFNSAFNVIGEKGVMAIELFNKFAPAIMGILPAITLVRTAFGLYRTSAFATALASGGMSAAFGTLTASLAATAVAAWAAMAPLLPFIAIGAALVGIFVGLKKAINSQNESWVKFGAVLTAMLGPIGWLVGGFMLIKRSVKEFKEVLAGGEVKGGFMGFLQKVGGVVTAIGEIFSSATEDGFTLSKGVNDALERMGILPFVTKLGTWIVRVKAFFVGMGQAVGKVWDKIKAAADKVWESLKPLGEAFGNLFSTIGDLVSPIFDMIGGFMGADSAVSSWTDAGMFLIDAVLTPMKIAIDIIAGALQGVIWVITNVVNAFSWLIGSVKDLFTGNKTITEIGLEFAMGIWNGLTSVLSGLGEFLLGLIRDLPFGDKILDFFGVGGNGDAANQNITQDADAAADIAAKGLPETIANTKVAANQPSIVDKSTTNTEVKQITTVIEMDGDEIARKVQEKDKLENARG